MKERQRRQQKTFGNNWYDLHEDWELIESSFVKQYGIRLRSTHDMSYNEFCTLLAGLMEDTPLGNIVQIRSEEDTERLKNFTPEQKKIRDEWRIKLMDKQHKDFEDMTEEEKTVQMKQLQEQFKKAFGKK